MAPGARIRWLACGRRRPEHPRREDEHLIATGLAEALQDAGSIVLGPVPTVDKAIKKIESEPHIDGAVVDVNLGGTLAYPVADLSSPGRFPSSLPQAMSTTFFGTDILNLRIAPNPICSRPRRKRWSRPCRSHDDSGAKTLV